MEARFQTQIASVPDREQLVGELWWGDQLVAELSREGGDVLEIYPPKDQPAWRFVYAEFVEQLEALKTKLVSNQRTL